MSIIVIIIRMREVIVALVLLIIMNKFSFWYVHLDSIFVFNLMYVFCVWAFIFQGQLLFIC